jgi:hypothetical protein
LHEIVRGGRIAQMPQTIKANARREASVEFGFGLQVDARCSGRNRQRERRIAK